MRVVRRCEVAVASLAIARRGHSSGLCHLQRPSPDICACPLASALGALPLQRRPRGRSNASSTVSNVRLLYAMGRQFVQVLTVIELNSDDLTKPPEIHYIDSTAIPSAGKLRAEVLKERECVMQVLQGLIKWASEVCLTEQEPGPNSAGADDAARLPDRLRARSPLTCCFGDCYAELAWCWWVQGLA